MGCGVGLEEEEEEGEEEDSGRQTTTTDGSVGGMSSSLVRLTIVRSESSSIQPASRPMTASNCAESELSLALGGEELEWVDMAVVLLRRSLSRRAGTGATSSALRDGRRAGCRRMTGTGASESGCVFDARDRLLRPSVGRLSRMSCADGFGAATFELRQVKASLGLGLFSTARAFEAGFFMISTGGAGGGSSTLGASCASCSAFFRARSAASARSFSSSARRTLARSAAASMASF